MGKKSIAKPSKDLIIIMAALLTISALALFANASSKGESGVRMDYRVDSGTRRFFYNETGALPYDSTMLYYVSQSKAGSQPDVLKDNGYRLDLTPTNVPPNITDTYGIFDLRQITTEIIWSALSLVLNNSYGTVHFNRVVDLSHKDSYNLDQNINMSQNWIEINSTGLPELNLPSTITLNSLTFGSIRILKDGQDCPDCALLSYAAGTAKFTVPGFTVYSTGESNFTPGIKISTAVIATNTSLNLTALSYNSSYPSNVTLVLGKTYTIANISGIFNGSAKAPDFTSALNTILDNNCTCTGCSITNSNLTCIVDLDLNSSTQGGVILSGLNISQAVKNVTLATNMNYTQIDLDDYFYDYNGNKMNYSSIGTTNVSISIENATGIVTLIPDHGWTGTEYARFIANNSFNTTLSNNFSITILTACGNGIKESPEQCDGGDFGNITCTDFVADANTGSPACSASCIASAGTCAHQEAPPQGVSTTTTTMPNLCEGIVCDDSTTSCSDGSTASCHNHCTDGICSGCIPSCPAIDYCKGVVCKKSSKICSDGSVATCNNDCHDGACANCEPKCPLIQQPLETGTQVATIPCLKYNYSSMMPMSFTNTNIGEIKIPSGYEVAIQPFETSCYGDSVQLTLSIPETYIDLRILRCHGGVCVPIQTTEVDRIACLDNASQTVDITTQNITKEANVEELKLREVNMTITEIQRTITSGETQVEFGGLLGNLTARLSTPIKSLPEPSNPRLKIIGSPLIISLDRKGHNMSTSIRMPYRISKDYDEDSLGIYVRNNNTWEYISSNIDKENRIVSGTLNNAETYADKQNEIQVAVIAEICEQCHVSEFKKIYEPKYRSRDAIILVHGLASRPETFTDMINDIKLTEQPFQVWTIRYPSDKNIDDNAEEFRNLMEAHSTEFDNIYIVSHSLGGIIAQKALYSGYIENKKGINKYTFVTKVRKMILVGVPNEGTPAIQLYENLFKNLVKKGEDIGYVNPNSPVIGELEKPQIVPRVPGIQYFVVAGIKPYDFNLLLFQISSKGIFNATIQNDGLISTQSAQHVGEGMINDKCDNYWELNLSHTELIDAPIARKILEKAVTKDIVTKEIATLGKNRYYTININNCTTGDKYVVIGKKIGNEYLPDETGCACGNGYCGIGENAFNCPSDCANIFSKENACRYAFVPISVLILILLALLAAYTYGKYYVGRIYGKSWIFGIVLIGALTILIIVQYMNTCKAQAWWIIALLLLMIIYFMIMPLVRKPKHAASIEKELRKEEGALHKALMRLKKKMYPITHITDIIRRHRIRKALAAGDLKTLDKLQRGEEGRLKKIDSHIKETDTRIGIARKKKKLGERIRENARLLAKALGIKKAEKTKEQKDVMAVDTTISKADRRLDEVEGRLRTKAKEKRKPRLLIMLNNVMNRLFGIRKKPDIMRARIKDLDQRLSDAEKRIQRIDRSVITDDRKIRAKDQTIAKDKDALQSLNIQLRRLFGKKPSKKMAIPKGKESLEEIDSKLRRDDSRLKNIERTGTYDAKKLRNDDIQIKQKTEEIERINRLLNRAMKKKTRKRRR